MEAIPISVVANSVISELESRCVCYTNYMNMKENNDYLVASNFSQSVVTFISILKYK